MPCSMAAAFVPAHRRQHAEPWARERSHRSLQWGETDKQPQSCQQRSQDSKACQRHWADAGHVVPTPMALQAADASGAPILPWVLSSAQQSLLAPDGKEKGALGAIRLQPPLGQQSVPSLLLPAGETTSRVKTETGRRRFGARQFRKGGAEGGGMEKPHTPNKDTDIPAFPLLPRRAALGGTRRPRTHRTPSWLGCGGRWGPGSSRRLHRWQDFEGPCPAAPGHGLRQQRQCLPQPSEPEGVEKLIYRLPGRDPCPDGEE
ncbi:basic helix-loop-helix transcription factor scleraxis isoform X2 [Dermochelys coriacea]|uniref:basic helix-loop-helix transcription factor scleraxis isoform X2 n=1 Tax=Dermochelys coriacea TaxID=27794 RepID=UPI001CA9A16F|nr:basic helix-loop-helix transcription factor scleraxis isoform X2 [Dermochelys coriacea]